MIHIPEETNEDKIYQLECQMSMLTDLVIQLISELKENGINISDKLKD
jgi:hypothetical protein